MIGKRLFSINNSNLSYELVEWDSKRQIAMFEDPDTEKTFNWFPGQTLEETKKIWAHFKFELGDPDEMPEIE